MVFTLPADSYKIDANGTKVPDFDNIQGESMMPENNTELEVVKFELLNIFDIPFIIILRNIANTIMAISSEIYMPSTYKNVNSFLQLFTRDNRLMYIGIILIFSSLFTSFFLY